jgi:GntR family transcriptional regulator
LLFLSQIKSTLDTSVTSVTSVYTVHAFNITVGGDTLEVIILNRSDAPIYEQIKEQVKAQILSGELEENEMLPSLRQLARDLKISVLTTTRAYNELEQEGFITSRQGKGFFVMSSSSSLIREQLIKEVESNLNHAIQAADKASMSAEELIGLLRLLLEVKND